MLPLNCRACRVRPTSSAPNPAPGGQAGAAAGQRESWTPTQRACPPAAVRASDSRRRPASNAIGAVAECVIHQPGMLLRQQTVLLHRMTGDAAIALRWVARGQARQVAGHAGVRPIIDEAALSRWADDAARNADFDAASSNPLHPRRQPLQWFIIEHEVATIQRVFVCRHGSLLRRCVGSGPRR